MVHWFGQSDLVASGSRTEVEARLLPFTFEAGLLGVADIADAVGCLMFGSAWWIRGVRVSEGFPKPRPRRPGGRTLRRRGASDLSTATYRTAATINTGRDRRG